MRALKLVVPAAFLMTGFLICTTVELRHAGLLQEGKEGLHLLPQQDRVQREAMPKNLNDAGKYYKDHDHKLDGYVPKK